MLKHAWAGLRMEMVPYPSSAISLPCELGKLFNISEPSCPLLGEKTKSLPNTVVVRLK